MTKETFKRAEQIDVDIKNLKKHQEVLERELKASIYGKEFHLSMTEDNGRNRSSIWVEPEAYQQALTEQLKRNDDKIEGLEAEFDSL